MGLAPYGEPKYTDLIYKHLIDLKEDGTFRLNMDYFNYAAGDAGEVLGAALSTHYEYKKNPRKVNPLDAMKGSYLGPKWIFLF